jgi:Zinc carboxypeptidase
VDRTWRKTRGLTTNLLCRGADPNRNWDVNWGQYGSSINPCSNSYHGDTAFSEPETRQLAEFMNSVPNLFGYISFHSYGQLLMLPYAFTSNFSTDHQLLLEIGQSAIQNLASIRDRQYRLGTINDFFGDVAGSSVDYVAINNSPKIVYCYELNNNHILPPEEIQATGRELFLSVMTIFRESVNRGLA